MNSVYLDSNGFGRYVVSKKKRRLDKKRIILLVIAFLFFWILSGFNLNLPDSENYISLFSRTQSGVTFYAVETGFWLLVQLAVKVGIDFKLFLRIYSFIAVFLIALTINRYSKKFIFVFFSFFCYSFLLDLVQIRFFMGMALCLFSIRFLEDFSIKNLILYCAFAFLASTQHLIFLSFFIFLLSYLKNVKAVRIISIVGLFLSLFLGSLFLRSSLATYIFSLRNKTVVYEGGIGSSAAVFYFVFFALLYAFAFYITHLYRDKLLKYTFIYKYLLVSLAFLPFILLDYQYTRLMRGIVIALYIYISNCLASLSNRQKPLYYSIYLILIAAVGLKLFGPGSGYFDLITKNVFEYNDFLNWIASLFN